MAKTNLRLDWSLDTAEEREKFLEDYLKRNAYEWSSSDIQTMGNYVLWGKEQNQKTAAENAATTIETKHKTWVRAEDESLDALLEQPTFNEAAVFSDVPTKVTKAVFNREQAMREAPEHMRDTFAALFEQIDRLDLVLNYYDLNNGRRTKEPRKELLDRFTEDDKFELRQEAAGLSQFNYLKKRHLLVELRNQQYTLRDSFVSQIQRTTLPTMSFHETEVLFDGNVPVFPLGVFTRNTYMELIFRDENRLLPGAYSEKELWIISDFLWEKKEQEKHLPKFYFDFRKEEHLGAAFEEFLDLDSVEENDFTRAFVNTIAYYEKLSGLSDLQKDILDMKIHKKTNDEIRSLVNKKYDKKYAVNYISTIFRQKVIPAIAQAAQYHLKIIENIFFEEEFKTCIGCGRTLLIDERNFMHKARSKDGFNNKCKECERENRKRKKNG